ncbi:uncharacterized protein TNCV_1869751 [Trichonephila clavipes]|nr:uncharacterized protein TNCV_1869751 [Trichonephila clavipes]
MVGPGHRHSLIDAVAFPTYLRHARLERDLLIWLAQKVFDKLDILSITQASDLHRSFREGRKSVEDYGCSCRPQSSHIEENIEKVSEPIRKKRLQTITQIAESIRIFKATCQWILAKDLNIHSVCQHIVPRQVIELPRVPRC